MFMRLRLWLWHCKDAAVYGYGSTIATMKVGRRDALFQINHDLLKVPSKFLFIQSTKMI
jgi:hypothetical protein